MIPDSGLLLYFDALYSVEREDDCEQHGKVMEGSSRGPKPIVFMSCLQNVRKTKNFKSASLTCRPGDRFTPWAGTAASLDVAACMKILALAWNPTRSVQPDDQ